MPAEYRMETASTRLPSVVARWAMGAALTATFLAVSAHAGSAAPQPASTPVPGSLPLSTSDYSTDTVLVKFRKSASRAGKASGIQAIRGQELPGRLNSIGVSVLRVPRGTVAQALRGLRSMGDVEYAEPNYAAVIADAVPNDPDLPLQWPLYSIQAYSAWGITTGTTGVTIAIVDTGVDATHPDLAGKTVAGYDIWNNDSDPADDNGHGTHVAGIAAATANNNMGMAGISWGARIMPVKVMTAGGGGNYDSITAGLLWAVDHGASIVNMSVGGTYNSQTLAEAVQYAAAHNVIVVGAAGNTGKGEAWYPAAYPEVIAVASTDPDGQRSSFSTFGDWVDVAAPGRDIYSTVPSGSCMFCSGTGYRYLTGTSMAAPHVAGLAAILAGIPRFDTPAKIREAIESTALDLGATGQDPYYGNGLIQAYSTVQYGLPSPTPTATPAPTLGISSLLSPGPSTELPLTRPKLKWTQVRKATAYRVEISTTESFVSTEQAAVVNSRTRTYTPASLPAIRHYWRVRAESEDGTVGAWSPVWSFVIDTSAPAAPMPESPTNTGSTGKPSVFTWSPSVGASAYEIQLSERPVYYQRGIKRTQVTGTSWAINSLRAGRQYYWWVRARDAAGNWSPWSAVWSIHIQ